MIKVLIMALMLTTLSFADDDGIDIIELDEITDEPKYPIFKEPEEVIEESEEETEEEEEVQP